MEIFRRIIRVLLIPRVPNHLGLRTIDKFGLNPDYGNLEQKSNKLQTIVTHKHSECRDLDRNKNI